MNIKYVISAALLILLGVILAFLPDKKHSTEIGPDELLSELNDNTRFISTDNVADLIINGLPSVQLIDVRPVAEYNKFSLPNSINIPLDSLLLPDWEAYIDQEGMKTIFYSNGTIFSSQAWMLSRRKGFSNLYIMKGGLNRWIETIMQAEEPGETASSTDIALYQFRKAAGQFFGGGTQVTGSSVKKKKKVVKKRKRKAAAEGGCS